MARGDEALRELAQRWHWPGSGAPGDPFVIEGLAIHPDRGHGVHFEATQLHVVLRSLRVTGGGPSWDGIRLVGVRNLTIEDSIVEGAAAGVRMIGVRDASIVRTTVKTSQIGVALHDTVGVRLSDNRLSVNEKDLSLAASTGNVLRNNNFSIATGQVAVHFEDAGASVDNDADGSNVVNGARLRWYTNIRGTVATPVIIDDARADLRGISNLAQVIVHNASHVVFESASGKSGIGDGILLVAADNVTLRSPAVEANAHAGLRFQDVRDVRVLNGTARANRDGAEVSRSARVHIDGLVVDDNGVDGLRVAGASNVTLERMRARASGRDGFSLTQADNVTLSRCSSLGNGQYGVQAAATRNLVMDGCSTGGNRGGGISLAAARGGSVTNSTLQGDTQGIILGDTRGVMFERNRIHPRPGGFGFMFDGAASYDNAIGTSNRAHNATVHWYTHLLGAPTAPVELPDVVAETPQVTNVAQVMLFGVAHVRLSAAAVANGTADGIVVHGSHNVTVHASASRGHGGHGIRLHLARDFALTDSVLRRNNGAGVLAEDSPRPRLVHNGALLNGAEGLRLVRSEAAHIERFTAERNGAWGVSVDGHATTAPTIVRHSEILGNRGGGILTRGAAVSDVANVTFTDNGPVGLRLESVPPGFRVTNSSFANHTAGIQLFATSGGAFHSNKIYASEGGIGIEFDVPRSYNQSIPPSNLYNNESYQWFAHMRGRGDGPVFARDVSVMQPGATNVAQLMVYDVENLTLDDVAVANGVRDGIVIHSSANVTLLDASAARHGRHGILVESSRDVRTQGVSTTVNAGDGIRVERSQRVHAAMVDASHNGLWGARLLASDARVVDSSLHANGEGGLRLEGVGGAGGSHTIVRVAATNNTGPGIEVLGARADSISRVTSMNNTGGGLRVASAFVDAVDGGTFDGNGGGGILIESSAVGSVASNTVMVNGGDGIRLTAATGPLRIHDNIIENHTRGIRLGNTVGAQFENNTLKKTSRQTGIWFDDVASYDSRISSSNTVNNQSVLWFVGIENRTLNGASVTLGGITNVAQIMLHRARNVTLVHPIATDGSADGIVAHQSVGVVLVAPDVRANRGFGVAFGGGGGNRLEGGSVATNRAGGVFVTNSPGSTIGATTIEKNEGLGVRVRAQSDRVTVRDARVVENAAGGIRVEESAAVRIDRNELAGNGGAALHMVRASPGLNVTWNRIAAHAAGVRLEATTLGQFADNEITITRGQVGLHFDDEQSYDNSIHTSNRVNGVPVRWYTALAGSEASPVVLDDVHVSVANITNVAQVMIHRSAYVHVVGATAVNGSARGIFLHKSSSIELHAPNVSATDMGVHLHATQSSLVSGAMAAGTRIGVRLTSSNDNTIRDTVATAARVGVELDTASTGNRVNGTHAADVSVASVADASVRGDRGNNIIVDAGRDVRAGIGRPVSFAEALAVWRLESERIVRQRWDFGDNATHEGDSSPSHVYQRLGNYTATLHAWTADGREYTDTTRVAVLGPLSAPTEFRAVQGPSSVRLTWTPPLSDGGSDIVAYRVLRGNSSVNATIIAEVAADAREHEDANDAAHVYAVAAVTAEGAGPASEWVLAAPGAAPPVPPRGVVAAPGVGLVTLTWSPPTDDGGLRLDGYRVYRAAGEVQEMTLLRMLPASVRELADVDVTNGVEYRYRIAAVNALGESPRSDVASTTPTALPAAPDAVRALSGDRRVTLTWQPPAAHPAAPVLHYRVYRGTSLEDQVLIAQVTDTFHRDEGLSNAGEYGYSVSAVTRVGEGARSPPVVGAPLPVDETAPVIRRVMPYPGSFTIELRPSVLVEFVDDGLVVETSIFFDGELVARERTDKPYLIWTPRAALTPGDHVVTARIVDAAGLATEQTWSFRKLLPEEELPRVSWENFTLDNHTAAPGDLIVARVTVRNIGYAYAEDPAHLLVDGVSWGNVAMKLPPGDSVNLTLEVVVEDPGTYAVRFGGSTPLPLVVADPAADASAGSEHDAETPAPPRARRAPRPLTGVPAAESGAEVPVPGGALVLVALAICAAMRRHGRREK